MDAATGLLYVGNGQYYDPATGRFLTRDAKPNNSNPYVPWDPTGAIIGPLGLMALFFVKRKKGSKWGILLVLLLVVGSVGLTLAACVPQPPQPTPTPPVPPDGTPQPGPGNAGSGTPGTPTAPIEPPEDGCPTPEVPPIGTPTPSSIGTVGVFGGSQGNDMLPNGPAIPSGQMKAWIKAPAGYTLWYSQYPGYHDYTLSDHPERQDFWNDPQTNSQEANGYAGKPGQAHWAFEYANPAPSLPSILVGYSAGADTAVLHAELRWTSGFPVEALVLLDPAFDSYDLAGQRIFPADYQQKLASMNMRVLIVDTESRWAGMSAPNIKYCPIESADHGTVDEDPILVDEVYTWISTGQIGCTR